DLVGHRGKQTVAALEVELACPDGTAERDLDVDLEVRGIHAGRVVDGVGIAASAGEAERDPGLRRHAEIGALADDADAQLGGGYAHGIIGAVADIVIPLVGAAHEGADAAEEEKIGPRFQDRLDDLEWGRLLDGEVEKRLGFAAETDGLLLAREDA